MSVNTKTIPDKKNWSQVYYTLLVISIILVPVSTSLGYASLNIINFTVNGKPFFNCVDLPLLTQFFADINTQGIIQFAAIIEAIIVLQFFFRKYLLSVIISALGFIICMTFMSICQLSIVLPFLKLPPPCY